MFEFEAVPLQLQSNHTHTGCTDNAHVEGLIAGRHCANHGGTAVATQRVLQWTSYSARLDIASRILLDMQVK
jgi:hypothetical protein